MSSVPPGLILVVGALLLPLLRGRVQQVALIAFPVLSALHLLVFLPDGTTSQLDLFGYQLMPIHVDRLSLVWGYIFHLAALISAVYAWHVRDTVQHVAASLYVGAAIGAVFAGDLITLFVNWELTAVASVFLIWSSRTPRSYGAGMRYVLVQVGSGVLLLTGILLHLRDTGSLAFVDAFHHSLPETEGLFRGIHSLDTLLIFTAFGIKAAFPLFHNWVTDAYPEATPTGTVYLSAFTTKLAIYALARGFPGTECLVWIGGAMTLIPILYALIENDLRRVLAYSLINQLGFMVVGVGLADFSGHPEVAEMALNGTAAHAVVHILYKGLLFMSIGAVLVQAGTSRSTELGGLLRSMPWTAGFCFFGTASIAAVPLFSGFVTKSMILTAAGESHHAIVWGMLVFAAAAAVLPDLKVPYYAFFGPAGTQEEVREAPINMLVAMGIATGVSVLIGIFPQTLYRLLPFEVDYRPYTFTHVVTQLQLLSWSVLAFVLLRRVGLFPSRVAATNLDSDWIYRRPFVRGRRTRTPAQRVYLQLSGFYRAMSDGCNSLRELALGWVRWSFRPSGVLSRTSSVSSMVAWVAMLLTAYLALYYVSGW